MEKGLSLAQFCHLAAVVVPLPLSATLGLPWLLQFLERAKSLPDVGLVHAVLSLLALPSPPVLCTPCLAPGLVNSSSPFKSQVRLGLEFSTASALMPCALQIQHR